jgi:hypothetical protein
MLKLAKIITLALCLGCGLVLQQKFKCGDMVIDKISHKRYKIFDIDSRRNGQFVYEVTPLDEINRSNSYMIKYENQIEFIK